MNAVKSVPISFVKEWKDNPRKNEGSVERLAALLKIHGQVKPIVAWTKNNVVYAGNTVLKALKFNKAQNVQVLFFNFENEEKAIAFGIEDNKSSEWSKWEPALLAKYMANKKMQVEFTGFTEMEKANLLKVKTKEKVAEINNQLSVLKDQIVVLIVDKSAREDIIALLENWVKTTGLKSIEVQK